MPSLLPSQKDCVCELRKVHLVERLNCFMVISCCVSFL